MMHVNLAKALAVIGQGKEVFIAPQAAWTKETIAREINDGLNTHYNIPLKENMITDLQARDFVVLHYQWLIKCIDRNEEENLIDEAEWQTTWYLKVAGEYFDQLSNPAET